MILLIISVFSIASLTSSLEVGCWHFGKCPDISVQQHFDVKEYQGVWHEQANYNTAFYGGNTRCVSANYTLVNNVLLVENRGISDFTNKWTGVNGTATETNPGNHEGKLTVSFPIYWWTVSGDYWVLGTNYTDYTVVYTCVRHLFFFHEYTIWFLSREQNLSGKAEDSFFTVTNEVLRQHNLDPSLMKRSSQSNCDVPA